jgi:hypothetical protein
MKAYKILYILGVTVLLTACSREKLFTADDFEIRGIDAVIDVNSGVTRAANESAIQVGRSLFAADDKIVFTTIKRTSKPLEAFTYGNIRYYYYEGKSWERTDGNLPEKIYWTDGVSPHTFIGYSLPSSDYHWTDNMDGTYAGELGYGVQELDFTAGNEAIKPHDLLLNYNTATVAETGGLSTKVTFNHALSNVCVVVNIKNFAASSSAVDTKVSVSDMLLKAQPALFTWGGDSRKLKVLDLDNEQQVKKDILMWCPKPQGEGTAQSKTFTFYALTTPQDELFHSINGNDEPLGFSFTVTYPDPMDPTGTPLVKTYSGTFTKTVNFQSGMCTTLNISLNHKDEQMFMGVEYNDWNYVSTPDLGELRKKSTFMDITSPVTTHDMAAATADDATWLYRDGDRILDIYGNDGSSEHPYRIASSLQMLSFAKEVAAGFSFVGRYVKQDADITMQSGTSMTSAEDENSHVAPVSWIGIGDADHPFQGTYLGGNRYVNRLCGKPLFASLGSDAQVIQVQITTIGSIQGGGALTVSNAGIIGACRIADDVTADGGAIAAFNSGVIYASCHIGDTHGPAGLVTDNTGSIIACYQAGQVDGGDPYSIAATGSGLVDCPAPSSLYQMQQEEFTGALNASLESWYQSNPNVTRFTFVHSTAGFPSIRP